MELEEELRVVGNNLKSLEVSEEKVSADDSNSTDPYSFRQFLVKVEQIISVF